MDREIVIPELALVAMVGISSSGKSHFLSTEIVSSDACRGIVSNDEKHYWVSEDEIDKLLRHGNDWVPKHPQKYTIVSRYLKKQGSLRRQALKQLDVEEDQVVGIQDDDVAVIDNIDILAQKGEAKLEKPMRLNDLRIEKILEAIRSGNVSSVIDFGCGEGRYLKEYLKLPQLKKVTGIEVSPGELLKAEQRLRIDRLPERVRDKLELLQGSLTYLDRRTQGYDLATCVEVIEHIDEDRLGAFKESLFGHASPQSVIITTPNREYNVLFEGMPSDKLRHADHRFEWNRVTFTNWAKKVASDFGYIVEFDSIGEEHSEFGAPTQMAIFRKSK